VNLSSKAIGSGLESKGFLKTENDHHFFIYISKSGKKTRARTKTSHGKMSQLSAQLLSTMAKQCKLTTKDFKDLITCPLSRDQYEEKLRELGELE